MNLRHQLYAETPLETYVRYRCSVIYIFFMFIPFFIEACPKRGSVVYIYIHVNLQEKYIQRTHSKF